MQPQVAHVLYCVQFNVETNTCTQQAWMPAPSLVPPLPLTAVGQLLSATLVCFVIAFWGREASRNTKN